MFILNILRTSNRPVWPGQRREQWRHQNFARGGNSVRIHEIRQKSQLLHKSNKLALSQLKSLWICGWNRKLCGVHQQSTT